MLCWESKLGRATEQAKQTGGCIVARHRFNNNTEWYEFASCTYQQLAQEIARSDQHLFEHVSDDVNSCVRLHLALKWNAKDFAVSADEKVEQAIQHFSEVLHQIGVQLPKDDVQVFSCGGTDVSKYKCHVVFGNWCCPRKDLKDLIEVAFPASDARCVTFSFQP